MIYRGNVSVSEPEHKLHGQHPATPSGTNADFDKYIRWLSIAQKISHDIKNPLSTLLLSIERIEESLAAIH